VGLTAAGAYLNAKFSLSKDIDMLRRLKRAERAYAADVAQKRISIWYAFADQVAIRPNQRCIWTREREYTFQEVHDHAVRYARWMLSEGIQPNDLVALYLLNSAQFMIVWLATTCIGAGPAFINYNLEGKALLHCTDVCQSKIIIVEDDEGCKGRIELNRKDLEGRGTKVVVLDEALKRRIEGSPVELIPDSYREGMEGGFPACLIYTRSVYAFPSHPTN
jgi:acyl-coenzyme A synthetase/AMP-(fatty) acid ligase